MQYNASYKAGPLPGVMIPSAPPRSPAVDLGHGAPSTPQATSPRHTHGLFFSENPKKQNSHRRLFIIGGVVLTILLCSIVGVVVFHLAPSHKPIPAPIELHTNCISCAILESALQKSGRTLNIAELDVKQDQGKLLCCLKTTSKSDTFLEMLLDDARQSAIAQGQTQERNPFSHNENTSRHVSALPPPAVKAPQAVATPSPPPTIRRNLAAALVGLENKIPAHVLDTDRYILKEWGTRSRYPVTFIRKEIKYDPSTGHFRMPRDGLYIINVHLGLTNMNKTDINFGQRLLRYNRHFPNVEQEILAYDSEKIPVGERRTSSLSSVFNLRKDDELFVQVAPAHSVVDDSWRSYLSVFLLSE